MVAAVAAARAAKAVEDVAVTVERRASLDRAAAAVVAATAVVPVAGRVVKAAVEVAPADTYPRFPLNLSSGPDHSLIRTACLFDRQSMAAGPPTNQQLTGRDCSFASTRPCEDKLNARRHSHAMARQTRQQQH